MGLAHLVLIILTGKGDNHGRVTFFVLKASINIDIQIVKKK
jgi:hypothetical protein